MLTALRSRDFRLLWLGQSVSVIGDALVIVAIGLYVTRLTGSAADVSFVLAAYATPLVVFLLIGGVVADRLPRQLVIITSSLLRAALHATLALLIATGTVRIWHMVVGVLYGSAEAFFRPAYTALVPQTVASDDDIQGAQALGGISNELANLASPALASALVLGVGGTWAFGVDAATFLVSAALVSQVHARDRGGQRREGESFVAELQHGWRAVRERPWVLWTIVCVSVALLTALAPFLVLGAAAAAAYGTEAVYGLATTAFGVGTMTGALIGSRWHPQYPMRVGAAMAILWPAAIGVYAAGPTRPVLYPIMALAGVGVGVSSVFWETALAQRVPAHLLSRVSAWDWMGSLALLPLGYVLSGWLGRLIGDARLLEIGGAIGSLALVLSLLPRSTRQLRRVVDPGALALNYRSRNGDAADSPWRGVEVHCRMADAPWVDPVDVVRRGYDALSRRYRADDDQPEQYTPWIAELLALLGPASRVLDVGCGCGVPLARAVTAAGHRVTGVDLSPVQVERATRLVPTGDFVCADVTTLSWPAASFEAVVALYSIIHVPLAMQPALLSSAGEWLVEDGLLLLTSGAGEWTGSQAGWLGGAADMWWSQADAATYRSWLADARLTVLREEFVPEGTGGHSLFWARRRGRSS